MRVIEFRALAVVNDKYNNIKVGDFVYGSFIQSNVDAPCIIWGDGEQIEIDSETLGQFTGLQDKNGVDIYEGDIVKHKKAYVWVVIFDDEEARFALKCKPPLLRPLYKNRGLNFEVIGNNHQNPELIKEGE